MPSPPLGVYVHVPFCTHRCDYCDFATWTDRAHLVDAYVDACVLDLEQQFSAGLRRATSVFFGGGTPSLLEPEALARIIGAVPLARGAEVTVECNPDSVDPTKLEGYRRAGADRVSIGVQSLRPRVLASLGRTHDRDNVVRAVTGARAAGFERVNLDVIFGAAGERLDDWRATIDGVLELEPDHVSAYALTVVPSTPLGRRIAAGTTPAPDDDDQATKYELVDAALADAGLDWYEISNWSRPGEECRHNLVYWDQGESLAIGCAAHGHRDGERWWNVRTPERYVEAIGSGASPRAGEELLDRATRAEEAFALALRTRSGAVAGPAARDLVDDLAAGGILVRVSDRHVEPGPAPARSDRSGGTRVVLTRTGRLLADDVTARLLLAGASDAGAPPAPKGLALGRLDC